MPKFKSLTKEELEKSLIFTRYFDDNYFGRCALFTSKSNRNSAYFAVSFVCKSVITSMQLLQETIGFYSQIGDCCLLFPRFYLLQDASLTFLFDFPKTSNLELKVMRLIADNKDLSDEFRSELASVLTATYQKLHSLNFYYGHLYFDSVLLSPTDDVKLKFFPFNYLRSFKFTVKGNFIQRYLKGSSETVAFCDGSMTKTDDLKNLEETLLRLSDIYALRKFYDNKPNGKTVNKEFLQTLTNGSVLKVNFGSTALLEEGMKNGFQNNKFMTELAGDWHEVQKLRVAVEVADFKGKQSRKLEQFALENGLQMTVETTSEGIFNGNHKIGCFECWNGDFYVGLMSGGRYHGWGTCLMTGQSEVYVGEFEFGKFNGYGELVCSDGSFHKGFWKDGMKWGKGVFLDSGSQRLFKGEWREGKLTGLVWVYLLSNNIKVATLVDAKGTLKIEKSPIGFDGKEVSLLIDSENINDKFELQLTDSFWNRLTVPLQEGPTVECKGVLLRDLPSQRLMLQQHRRV